MRGGPPPPGYGYRGYDPRGWYRSRDPRNPGEYEHYRRPGPSPWIPATILGVVLLITVMPYLRASEPTIAYTYQPAVRSPTSSFPYALLWIPVVAVIALQYFSGNWYYGHGDERFARFAMRGGGGYGGRGGAYGRDPAANRGWGGWWSWTAPSWSPYNRYNNQQQQGWMSMFLDYSGHWLLIFLGIVLFTLVSY
jgi:hypothetical protein